MHHATFSTLRPFTSAPSELKVRCSSVGGAWSRCVSVMFAALLAACSQSPQAAVQMQTANTSHPVKLSAGEPHVRETACRDTPSVRSSLDSAAKDLLARGLVLTATCSPTAGKGWVLQLRVVDGVKASTLVRGPLADGHIVDMGTPSGAGVTGASTTAQGFSPDVAFNRQWLSTWMQKYQFHNLPDAWWHYAQRGVAGPDVPSADTDLASR